MAAVKTVESQQLQTPFCKKLYQTRQNKTRQSTVSNINLSCISPQRSLNSSSDALPRGLICSGAGGGNLHPWHKKHSSEVLQGGTGSGMPVHHSHSIKETLSTWNGCQEQERKPLWRQERRHGVPVGSSGLRAGSCTRCSVQCSGVPPAQPSSLVQCKNPRRK